MLLREELRGAERIQTLGVVKIDSACDEHLTVPHNVHYPLDVELCDLLNFAGCSHLGESAKDENSRQRKP
jgi:hypothetical protein